MNSKLTAWASLAAAAVISGLLTLNYADMWRDDVIIPGPGVTKVKWLSEYNPDLRGTLPA